MKSVIKYASCECGLSDDELRAAVRDSLSDCKANLKKVLLLPPDYTRFHSYAGRLTAMYYEELKDTCHIDILPALGNEFIMMLKETSLASTFFLGDLMTSYSIVKGVTYLTLEPMTIVAIIYLCMTFPLSKIVERFEKKMASPNSYKKHKKLTNGGKN